MAFDLMLVQNPAGGGQIPAALAKRIEALCKAEELPPEGITIMGGNPYINVTGLDNKIRRRAERENLVFAGCAVEAVPADGDRREFKATVTYFDKAGFAEAIRGVNNPSADVLRALQQAFTYAYSDIGSCSPETAKMSTMRNADNIAMLASRRASNRAKRAACGIGLTSIDEVAGEIQNGKHKGPAIIDIKASKVTVEGSDKPDGGAGVAGAEGAVPGDDSPREEPEPTAGAVPASAAAPPAARKRGRGASPGKVTGTGGAETSAQGSSAGDHNQAGDVSSNAGVEAQSPPPQPHSSGTPDELVVKLRIHLANTAKRLGRDVEDLKAEMKLRVWNDPEKSSKSITPSEFNAAMVWLTRQKAPANA